MLRKNLLRITASLAVVFATNSYAIVPGPYIGVQFGWDKIHRSALDSSDMNALIGDALSSPNYSVSSVSHYARGEGIAGRALLGLQLGPNLALEAGWAKFTNLPIHNTANGFDDTAVLPFTAQASGSVRTDAYDLVAKLTFPLPYQFNVYAKLGGAYVEQRSSQSVTVNETGSAAMTAGNNLVKQRYLPTYGLGIGYDLTPCANTDISWYRIQRTNTDTSFGNIDFVALGVSYHFGG